MVSTHFAKKFLQKHSQTIRFSYFFFDHAPFGFLQMDALPFGDAKGHACGHNLIAIGTRTIEHAIPFFSLSSHSFFLRVNLTFFFLFFSHG